MSQEFGDDYISITDDDGKEYELEILAEVEYNGAHYLGVCPAGADDAAEESLEVSILRVEQEDGEDILCTVDDEAELDAVYALLLEDDAEEDGEKDE